MAWPPRCVMAVSKLTRVRSEGFSKIIASVLLVSVAGSLPARKAALSEMARSKSQAACAELRSAILRKSFIAKPLEESADRNDTWRSHTPQGGLGPFAFLSCGLWLVAVSRII